MTRAAFSLFPVVLSAAFFGLAACGGAAAESQAPGAPRPPARAPSTEKVSSSEEAFRKQPPAAGTPQEFAPPKVHEEKLANGIRVLVVERHDVPLAAVRLVFDRGALHGAPAVAAFAAELLRGGTKTKNALALENAWADLGSEVSAGTGEDSLYVAATATSDKLSKMLDLLSEMVTSPALPADEIERTRKKMASALAAERADPERLLRVSVRHALYGKAHPGGVSVYGNDEAVRAMSKRDIEGFLRTHLRPADATLVVAGDVTTDSVVRAASKAFGAWKGEAGKTAVPKTADRGTKGPRMLILDRPGATQSHVSAADVSITRASPDYYAVRVLGMVLGGQFSSRLNMNLREKHAYTYGAGARFDAGRELGTFTAGGAIVKEKTAPAIKEMFFEIEQLRAAPVTDAELALAKTSLIQPYAASFETVDRTASVLAELAAFGLPVDEVEAFPKRVQSITKEDVLRVAKTYLRPEELRVVMVGDAKVVKDSLEGLGMGPVEVQSAKPGEPAKDAKAGDPAKGAERPAKSTPPAVTPTNR